MIVDILILLAMHAVTTAIIFKETVPEELQDKLTYTEILYYRNKNLTMLGYRCKVIVFYPGYLLLLLIHNIMRLFIRPY